jgi:hypothetical protein
MHALAGEHVRTDQIEQRLEQRRATAHLVGERRQAQLDGWCRERFLARQGCVGRQTERISKPV